MLLANLTKQQAYAAAKTTKKNHYHELRALRCCVACGKSDQSKARCDDCAAKLGTRFRWAENGLAEEIVSRDGSTKLGKTVQH